MNDENNLINTEFEDSEQELDELEEIEEETNKIEIEVQTEYLVEEEPRSEILEKEKEEENIMTITKKEPEEQVENSPTFIHTKFGSKTQPVQFTIIATGQSGTTSITGGKLRLIYGRIYFLPIDAPESINSDNFANIKMFSDMADKIDVRYINNQYAAVIPIQNNIMLVDESRLCVLW